MNLKYSVNWANLASRMLLCFSDCTQVTPIHDCEKLYGLILITFWCPRESGVFDPVYEDTVNHKLLLSWFLIFDANLMAVCYSVNKQGKNLRWFWYLFCRLNNKRLMIVCAHVNNIQSLHTYLTARQIYLMLYRYHINSYLPQYYINARRFIIIYTYHSFFYFFKISYQ